MFESELRRDGYRLVAKTGEHELLPGEYLKRQRSTYVYTYASPVVWEVVWSDRAGHHVQTPANPEVRSSRR
jgi:hypothetical protein